MSLDRILRPAPFLGAAAALLLATAPARGQAIDVQLPVVQVAAGANGLGQPDVAGVLMPVEAEREWPIPGGTYLYAHVATDLGAIDYDTHVHLGSGWDGLNHKFVGTFFIPDLVVSGPGTSAVVTVNMHHAMSVTGPLTGSPGGTWTLALRDPAGNEHGLSHVNVAMADGLDETLVSQPITVPVGTPFSMTFSVVCANFPGGAFGQSQDVFSTGSCTLAGLNVLNLPAGYTVDSVSANIVDNQLVPSPQAWSDLGQALAGTHGEPTLAGQGPLLAGTGLGLALDNALESAPVALVIGLSELNAPFKGGTLVPFPDILLLGLATDVDGRLGLVGNWPAGVPSGLGLVFQEWITDPAGVAGLAATNAVRAIVP